MSAYSERQLRLSPWLTAFLWLLLVHPAVAQDDDWRTIEFETSEVTAADMTISPDGQDAG